MYFVARRRSAKQSFDVQRGKPTHSEVNPPSGPSQMCVPLEGAHVCLLLSYDVHMPNGVLGTPFRVSRHAQRRDMRAYVRQLVMHLESKNDSSSAVYCLHYVR